MMLTPRNLEIIDIAVGQFKLSLNGDHGIKHWDKVAKIGAYLAERTRADIEVVGLFAYLHDAKREDELFDPEHGARAAAYVKELYDKGLIAVTADQMEQLITACRDHSNSRAKSPDITIQTCWDADRLDLYRLGIMPNPDLLYTPFAKTNEAIGRAVGNL